MTLAARGSYAPHSRAVMLVVATTLWLALASTASASWTLQTSPNPSGASDARLTGVACSASNACVSVGGVYDTPNAPMAQTWNGSTWALSSVPSPAGSARALLLDATCTSSSACLAVGNHTPSGGNVQPLIERYNGSSWAIQSSASPTTNTAGLSDVSCSAANACTAVGQYVSSGAGLLWAERWDGTAWTLQTVPTPSGAGTVQAEGVSCPTATTCFAVGRAFFSSGVVTMFIAQWNGTSWALQSVPSPAGAAHSALLGISCTSSVACTAAGGWKDAAFFQQTLIERWNGTTWSVQATPSLPGSLASVFQDVSCTGSGNCEAVGDYIDGFGNLVTLAENWNGTTWSVQSTPNASGALGSQLMSVSCISASTCESVGWATTASGATTLAETGP